MSDPLTRYSDVVSNYMKLFREGDGITKNNADALLSYKERGFANKSDATVSKNLQVCLAFAKKLGKDFKDAEREDLEKIVEEINNNSRLSAWTKAKYLICIKRFYKWLFNCKKHTFPEVVDWIETEKPKKKALNPDSLWRPEDVRCLIAACSNARDRFIVSLLYDTGCRSISELEKLNCEDVADKNSYLQVSFQFSKTFARNLPIVNSLPYFREYSKQLKARGAYGTGKPLLVENQGRKYERLAYDAILRTIQRATQRAGINKKKNLHFFRKSTASLYASYFSNELALNKWFGWGSGVKDYYVVKSTMELLNEYRKFYESQENALKPLRCHSCNADTLPGYLDVCSSCGSRLTKTTALGEEMKQKETILNLLEIIEGDPTMRHAIVDLLEKAARKGGKCQEIVSMAD